MRDNKNNLFSIKCHLLWLFGLCLVIIVLIEAFEYFMNYEFLEFGKLFRFNKLLCKSQFCRIYLIGRYKSVLPLQYLFIFLPGIFSFVLIFRLSKNKISQYISLGAVICLTLLLVSVHEKSIYDRWHNGYYKVADSYLNIQEWAKENTKFDSLFMIDPSHSYSWEEFSERSSFGTFRQWIHTSILVNSNNEILNQGLERTGDFNINVENLADFLAWRKERRREGIYYQKLRRKIRKVFYHMGSVDFVNLSRKYGIDYIVMKKKYHKEKFNDLKIAYENEHYIVYKI